MSLWSTRVSSTRLTIRAALSTLVDTIREKGLRGFRSRPAAKQISQKTGAHIGSMSRLSYGPPWARYLGGCQDRLLSGPLGLPGLRYTAPEGVEHKDYTGVVLG
jgi:hypothetical protein